MNNKKIKIISLLLIILIFLSGCKSDISLRTTNKKEDVEVLLPVEGGEVVLPLTNFRTLNPLSIENPHYYHFSKLIFEGLFEFDENLKPVEKLASDYSIDKVNNIISIDLREDVIWHDGSKFTAEDVGFTIDVIKASGPDSVYGKVISNNLGNLQAINIYEAIDYEIKNDHKIDIIFNKGYGNALEILTFPIISKDNFKSEDLEKSYEKALELEGYNPVGTGPYKFVKMESYKFVELERNIDYWDGSPYIEKVVGKILESDDSIKTSYETGQLNMALSEKLDWDKYSQNSRIRVIEFVSPSYEFLGFNFNKSLMQDEKGVEIRKAIAHAIDREGIIDKVYLGHGTMVDTPIFPDSYLGIEELRYDYNKNKAERILENAGYKEKNEEGILIDENGLPLEFTFLTNSYNTYRNMTAELIIQDLKEVGIKLIPDYDEEYFDNIDEESMNNQWEITNNKLINGNYDLVLLGWDNSSIIDLTHMFHTSKIGRDNFIRYSNEKLDKSLEDVSNSISEDLKIKEYEKINEYVLNDLPYVSLYYKNSGLLIDKKIKGDLKPMFFNLYNGLNKCFISDKDN